MKVALIINTTKINAENIAIEAANILRNSGFEIYLSKECGVIIENAKYLHFENLFDIADIFVAVGGDGTIIHTAKKAAMKNKPVLGINAGRVGYLAGVEPEEIEKLYLLAKKEYVIEKRMMLSIIADGNKFYALNDAVISKGKISRMIDINFNVGSETFTYRADGLIVATPTGSTAYSLSAGGPVIDPHLESIVLTPICSRSLFARPILLNSTEIVNVSANAPYDAGVYLTIDGENSCPLNQNSTVTVKKAENIFVQLIKLNDGTFLSALSEKFNLLG